MWLDQVAHLFENEDTVSRTNKLRQLRDATLVKVRPREAAMVEVDLWAAVFTVPLSCSGKSHVSDKTTADYSQTATKTTQLEILRHTHHPSQTDWQSAAWQRQEMMTSGESCCKGAKTWWEADRLISDLLVHYSCTHCFSGCTTAIFLSFSTTKYSNAAG